MPSVPPPATPAALPVATAVALNGRRVTEARAAEAAQQAALAADQPMELRARALFEALQAAPDLIAQLGELHQARQAYAEALRGASAQAAALLRWSV